ncbi:MAG: hypothetical protein CVV49_08655 [Spirochaetae bacterium HGW-Spirochaetae-5]|nr:MAG: hypothetical protein CVV49_08655 [Spirochaetae bacterium HGW-Spirochaetae-5]
MLMNINEEKKKLLREKAEKIMGSDDAETIDLSRERMREIIHELRVHQIELELQNEEMQRTYSKLIAVRDGFARLFNNSPVGYLMLDSNGLIMMTNKTFSEMTGRSEGSLTGKSFADLFPSPDREIFIGRWKAFYKNPADKNITVKLLNSGSSPIYINITGRLEPEGLITQPGTRHSNGILIIANDITLQLKADEELFKTERKFRLLAENIDETFWLKDIATGTIEYISPAYESMWGEPCENLYKNPMSFLRSIHPDDLDKVKEMQQSLLSENKMFDLEYRIMGPDGDIRWVSARTYPVPGPDGEIIKYAGIAEDITEKKIQNDNIQRLLTEKEILLKEVHHRVKNNMNMISGLLYLQASNSCKEASDGLMEAQRRVISMSVLYDRLYRSTDFRGVRADEYFRDFLNEIDQTLSHDGRIVIQNNIDSVEINSIKMISVGIIVNELVTNALKYAFPDNAKGIITINLKLTDAGIIRLSVRDNGIGLPDSYSQEEATGFGLSMVNLLTEQIGGEMEILRNNGSEFVIKFKNS